MGDKIGNKVLEKTEVTLQLRKDNHRLLLERQEGINPFIILKCHPNL